MFPDKNGMRRIVMFLWEHENEASEIRQLAEEVKEGAESGKGLNKAQRDAWAKICDECDLKSVDDMRKDIGIRKSALEA